MLTTAVNRESEDFFQSITYLWAQLRSDKFDQTDSEKVTKALRAVTQEYAGDNYFEDPKQIQNLVSCVLSNLQFGFTSQANVTDKELTLNLVIDNPPTGNRFTAIANSLFETIRSKNTVGSDWRMTYTSDLSTCLKSHQLSFVRVDRDK